MQLPICIFKEGLEFTILFTGMKWIQLQIGCRGGLYCSRALRMLNEFPSVEQIDFEHFNRDYFSLGKVWNPVILFKKKKFFFLLQKPPVLHLCGKYK